MLFLIILNKVSYNKKPAASVFMATNKDDRFHEELVAGDFPAPSIHPG